VSSSVVKTGDEVNVRIRTLALGVLGIRPESSAEQAAEVQNRLLAQALGQLPMPVAQGQDVTCCRPCIKKGCGKAMEARRVKWTGWDALLRGVPVTSSSSDCDCPVHHQ
jgi:hypothetical protein